MTEEAKYYTPEIEEFHVGFEYEWRNKGSNDWNTAKIKDPEQLADVWNTIYDLRVKYLDRSDIESLGYGIIQDEHNCQWFKNANGNIEIGLENDYHLTIRFTQSFGLFSGTIKNKSELKRLLKQLGT